MHLATGKLIEPIKVRRSKIHGTGVFAQRHILKGARIIEYIGDRVSHDEADTRYEHRPIEDNHTFLFIVDSRTVIDAGVGGNAARFINHSCNPNCETVIDDRRVFIEAIRDIEPGEELGYDYQITRDDSDPPNIDEIFACRCGAAQCRGSMLEPVKAKRTAAPAQRNSAKSAKSRTKSKGKKPGKRAGSAKSSRNANGKAKAKSKSKAKSKAKSNKLKSKSGRKKSPPKRRSLR